MWNARDHLAKLATATCECRDLAHNSKMGWLSLTEQDSLAQLSRPAFTTAKTSSSAQGVQSYRYCYPAGNGLGGSDEGGVGIRARRLLCLLCIWGRGCACRDPAHCIGHHLRSQAVFPDQQRHDEREFGENSALLFALAIMCTVKQFCCSSNDATTKAMQVNQGDH